MAGLVKFAIKAGLAGGAVYAAINYDVWSMGLDGTKALDQMRSQILPETNEYFNKVPSKKCVNTAAIKTWNSGVEKTFNAIADAPDTVCKYSHKAVQKVKESVVSSS